MVLSAAAHAAVLAYAAIGFNWAKPFEAPTEALPVEVLTLSEFDQLTKGSNQSKTAPTEKPKVEAKKVAAVNPDPLPPAPEAKENVTAPPAPKEPEKVEKKPPEPPKPEPEKAEAKPEPKPEPKPADLPKPEKKVEKKPEPKKAEKKPEKPKPKFDPSKIANLIDKRDPGRTPQEAPEISKITTAGISNGTASMLSLSQQSMIGNMIREQLYSCWNPPVGILPSPDLVATIEFDLTEAGTLVGTPRLMNSSGNPSFQSFAESAMRAVHSCTQSVRPLRLPVEHYNIWKIVTLDFILPS